MCVLRVMLCWRWAWGMRSGCAVVPVSLTHIRVTATLVVGIHREACLHRLFPFLRGGGSSVSLLLQGRLRAVLCCAGPAQLVFSSSCTVYGMVEKTPITEDFPLQVRRQTDHRAMRVCVCLIPPCLFLSWWSYRVAGCTVLPMQCRRAACFCDSGGC